MVTAVADYVPLSLVEFKHKDVMVTALAHYVTLTGE